MGLLAPVRPGILLPSDVAGLQLWLRADVGLLDASGNPITVDGTPVKTWVDQSGGGHDAIQATVADQPAWKANIQNGLAVVRFTAAGPSFMTSSLSASATSQTVLAVVRPTTTTGVGVLLGASAPGGYQLRAFNADGVGKNTFPNLLSQGTTQIRYGNTALSTSAFQILTSVTANSVASSTFAINGVATTGTAGTWVGGFTGGLTAILGSEVGGLNPYPGDIAELLVYNTNLSAASITALTGYLSERWGLGLAVAGLPVAPSMIGQAANRGAMM